MFERTNNRIHLTSAGQRLYHAVTGGLDEILVAIREISQVDTPKVFRVTCTYDIAHCWLLPKYSAFLKALGAVDLQIITSEERVDFNEFTTEVQIKGAGPVQSNLETKELLHETVVPVCSPEFSAQHAGILTSPDPRSICALPLLHLTKENLGWASWETWFQGVGVENYDALRTQRFYNYAFMVEAAIAGEGIALGWDGFLDIPLQTGRLVLARPERVETDFFFQAIWRTGYADPDIVTALITFLKS